YAVFGKVVSGMFVMDKIASVKTGADGPFRSDVPETPIVILKMSEVKPAATPDKKNNSTSE
ncbi:MAG: peptidylprolyl isomerase, partial [Gammaproteobacteria bacterium]|nr:peptidylprolyl isomerase [Gammaproteobacteria bacterium]